MQRDVVENERSSDLGAESTKSQIDPEVGETICLEMAENAIKRLQIVPEELSSTFIYYVIVLIQLVSWAIDLVS